MKKGKIKTIFFWGENTFINLRFCFEQEENLCSSQEEQEAGLPCQVSLKPDYIDQIVSDG